MANVRANLETEETSKPFLVNTKSVCFLCLKRSRSSSPVSSSGSRGSGNNHGRVKVNDDCHEVMKTGKELVEPTTEPLSLRTIFRHLQLDTQKTFSDAFVDSPLSRETEPLRTMTDFAVYLCAPCGDVVRSLSSLCLDLEYMQMKVDHVLETFQEILESKENVDNLLEMDENGGGALYSPHGLDMMHAVAADVLREKTKELCLLKLKSTLPSNGSSVKNQPLIKIESSSCITLTASSNSNTENVTPTSEASFRDTPTLDDIPSTSTTSPSPPFEAEESNSSDDTHLSESEMLQITAFKLPLMTDVPQKRDCNNLITCCLCPTSANSIFGKEILFHRHVICCHLDFLFASVKDPRFSMEQFKAYCEYLMELQISSCSQVDGRKKRNTDEIPGFVCHTCGDIFHEVKVFVAHMAQSHYDFFATKLLHLQKSQLVTPEMLMNRKRSEIFIMEGPRYKCEDCGRVFVVPSSLYRHKRTPCQNGSAPVVADRPYICDHCGLSFKSSVGRKYHVKRIHLGIDHNRDRVSCELCGKIMSKSSIGRHKSVSCSFRKRKSGASHERPPAPKKNTRHVRREKAESSRNYSNFDDVSYYLTEKLEIEVTEVDDNEDEDTPVIVCTSSIGNRNVSRPVKRRHHQAFPSMLESYKQVEEEIDFLDESEAYDEEEEDDEMILFESPGGDPLQIRT